MKFGTRVIQEQQHHTPASLFSAKDAGGNMLLSIVKWYADEAVTFLILLPV